MEKEVSYKLRNLCWSFDVMSDESLVAISKRSKKHHSCSCACTVQYTLEVKGSALPLLSPVIQQPRSSSPHFWLKCSSACRCHLNVQGLLYNQLLSPAMLQHQCLLPCMRTGSSGGSSTCVLLLPTCLSLPSPLFAHFHPFHRQSKILSSCQRFYFVGNRFTVHVLTLCLHLQK